MTVVILRSSSKHDPILSQQRIFTWRKILALQHNNTASYLAWNWT